MIEINRPGRQSTPRHGKNDTVDAIAAARAVLSGEAASIPRIATGKSRVFACFASLADPRSTQEHKQ